MSTYNPQDALVAVMVATSAADQDMSGAETLVISNIVQLLPVFIGYDTDRINVVAQTVADLLEEEDGLDALIGLVKESLPDRLHETAYALACDVAAADGRVNLTELRFLEMLRYDLNVGRLPAAAIERGARARHARLT